MIKNLLKAILGITGVMIISVSAFFFYMRYHDGPMAIITGGPFQSGTIVAEGKGNTLDISALKDRSTTEFQSGPPPRSRTVWLAVHDSRLFIASAYMNENYAKIWKQWPHQIKDNNKILLRIDGNIYQRQLIRTYDPEITSAAGLETERKYGLKIVPEDVKQEHVWLYEVVARDQDNPV